MTETNDTLATAFEHTIYRVIGANAVVDIRIGAPPPPALLAWRPTISRETPAWIVTADNPKATQAAAAENESSRARLDAWLAANDRAWLATRHIDPTGEWPDEHGRLIADMDNETARQLARRFGQAALVAIDDQTCRLVWIDS